MEITIIKIKCTPKLFILHGGTGEQKKFKRRISNLNFKIAQAYKFCGRYVEKRNIWIYI